MDDIKEQNSDNSEDLTMLTARQREVYLMRGRGMSFRQIGEELGIHPNNARDRFTDAKRVLREYQLFHLHAEHNRQPVELELTRSDLENIREGLCRIEHELCRKCMSLSAQNPKAAIFGLRLDSVRQTLVKAERELSGEQAAQEMLLQMEMQYSAPRRKTDE